jgi:hypothetical protein
MRADPEMVSGVTTGVTTVSAAGRARALGRRAVFVGAVFVGVAVMAFAIMSPQGGRADSSDGIIVTARSFEPVPAGASIFVKILDNSTVNLQLRSVIKRELTAQSRTLTDEAPLVLRFTTDHPEDTGTVRPGETRAGATTRYRLHVSLEWHETGQVLWRGDAVGSLIGANEAALGTELAVALIEQLGRTVEPRH